MLRPTQSLRRSSLAGSCPRPGGNSAHANVESERWAKFVHTKAVTVLIVSFFFFFFWGGGGGGQYIVVHKQLHSSAKTAL